jgi:hypothetical protein
MDVGAEGAGEEPPQYPFTPGHRGVETSVAAAAEIAPNVGRLQRLVLNAIAEAKSQGRTTDELADVLQIDRGSIQPRTSELRAMRKIIDCGERRRNGNGKRVIVWTLPDYDRESTPS